MKITFFCVCVATLLAGCAGPRGGSGTANLEGTQVGMTGHGASYSEDYLHTLSDPGPF